VLGAEFVLLEFSSPSRRIFIGSHSLPPLWFAVSVLHNPISGYYSDSYEFDFGSDPDEPESGIPRLSNLCQDQPPAWL
jgi:hypothetical protein